MSSTGTKRTRATTSTATINDAVLPVDTRRSTRTRRRAASETVSKAEANTETNDVTDTAACNPSKRTKRAASEDDLSSTDDDEAKAKVPDGIAAAVAAATSAAVAAATSDSNSDTTTTSPFLTSAVSPTIISPVMPGAPFNIESLPLPGGHTGAHMPQQHQQHPQHQHQQAQHQHNPQLHGRTTVAMEWLTSITRTAQTTRAPKAGLPLTSYSPLHLACLYGKVRVLRWIVNQGQCDINARDGLGRTPLQLACMGGHLRAVRALIQLGAAVHTATFAGETAFLLACGAGQDAIVAELLAVGSDLCATDHRGATAAYLACAGGHIKVLRTLEAHDADLTTENTAGITPLGVAAQLRFSEVTSFLRGLGLVDERIAPVSKREAEMAEAASHVWEWFVLPTEVHKQTGFDGGVGVPCC